MFNQYLSDVCSNRASSLRSFFNEENEEGEREDFHRSMNFLWDESLSSKEPRLEVTFKIFKLTVSPKYPPVVHLPTHFSFDSKAISFGKEEIRLCA